MQERIDKANQLIKELYKGQQHTWPNEMFIYVKVGDLRNVQCALLGEAPTYDVNAVGARIRE